MAADKIGPCKCPLCKSERARLSLTKSGLACITCNGCNFQGFARSGDSDEHLRSLLLGASRSEPPPQELKPVPAAAKAAVVEANAVEPAKRFGFMLG